jgi:hypothetical protein
MSLVNTLVSYVGSQIIVKVPTAAVPDSGPPPFTIMSISYAGSPPVAGGQIAMDLSNVIPSAAVDGYRSYSITASPTSTYSVQVGNITTATLMNGENYELQQPQGGGAMVFKNLDTTAPTLDSITTLSAYNLANGTTYVPPGGQADQSKTYFVAKFSEAVYPPSSQSFSVTQNGTSLTNVPSVMPLTLTGSVLSSGGLNGLPAASLYLVAVDNIGANLSVALKTPPTILSVQEMNAAPLPADVTGVNYGSNSNVSSWLKVSTNGDVGQFLSQNPQVPGLQFELAGNYPINGSTQIVTPPMAQYAVAGTDPKVLYIGFSDNSAVNQLVTEAPISIKFQTNGSTIRDTANNSLVPSASANVTAAKYLDATGEPVFSKWGDDTTTISNASIVGYANGASVNPNINAPRYYTDGIASKDAMGRQLYDANWDLIGMDTIDLSGITGTPININAPKGEASVYVGGKWAILDVSDYDRFILNDRAKDSNGNFVIGNDFIGTVDSEYVVVGSGGDNFLFADNRGATEISSSVLVKNFKFNSTGILAETDIVDYSQLATGITVNLGDLANAPVSVVYKDGTMVGQTLTGRTQQDTLIGFEGVVGSRGNDEISGSNIGNVLAGGAGNDELRGYTAGDQGDKLYNQTFLAAEYGIKGTASYKEAQFLVDSSDILYGGAGADKLYGGAGRDMLIDLGNAEMWGSNTGRNADGTFVLRSSADKTFAENDVFWVRGDGTETATIKNFHLSKDGTGLAGRSNTANDSIIFSVDTTKLFDPNMTIAQRNALSGDYNSVYSNLTFEQKVINTDDIEMVVNYKKADGSSVKVGSTIIADIGLMLNGGANRAEVVDMKWLTNGLDDPLYLFNPKIDQSIGSFIDTNEFGNDLNIAISLELLQAGTVRSTNEFGVMAAKLSDNNLNERVYNPGDKDDRILGTSSNDSYDYVVQKFSETNNDNQVGNDSIFDIGGTNDVLSFEKATIEQLRFSTVKVGRESNANSLRVDYEQTAQLDDNVNVTNRGQVTWQGHFQEGGRQAAETLQILGRDYAIAQANYEYDSKGYVKGGPKITADNARDVIMVGQGAADKFVFDFDPTAVRVGNSTTQSARIAGFDSADRIDISDYVKAYGNATASLVEGKAVITFNDTIVPATTNFTLELTFQDSAGFDAALQLLHT